MKATPAKKRPAPKFRPNSYEAALTPEELKKFHKLLLSGVSIPEVQAACIPWPQRGAKKAQPPSLVTLFKIRARFNTDEMLGELDGISQSMEGTREKLDALVKGTDAEKVLDQIMAIIGQQVIQQTLRGLNVQERTAAARLLLKRADQRRVDRRLDLIEGLEKDPEDKSKTKASPSQRSLRVKQILGIN